MTLALGRSHGEVDSTGLTWISGSTSKWAAYFRSRLRPERDRLDARAGGGAQLLLADRLGEGAAHQVADDFGADLVAELLGDDRERRLAGAEALQARGARELLQALLHLVGHLGGGNGHFQAPHEAAGVRYRNLHQFNPSTAGRKPRSRKPHLQNLGRTGAKGETRTLTGFPTGS